MYTRQKKGRGGDKRKALVLLIIGSTFHYVSLFMLPLIIFIDKLITKKTMFILLFLSFIIGNTPLLNKIIQLLPTDNYILYIIVEYAGKESDITFGIGTILKILIFIYYSISKTTVFSEKVRNFSIICLFFYILFIFLFKNIPTLSERMGHIFTIGYILASYDIIAVSIKKRNFVIIMMYMSICFLFYLQWIQTPSKGKSPAFIPYKSIELIY